MTKPIKSLSQFGEGAKYHHQGYQVPGISALRETGGVFEKNGVRFHFPRHFGFCYGVGRAIDMVFETLERFKDRRVFLTDELIHNPYINGKLREKQVRTLSRNAENLLDCSELREGDVVVISAFGTDFRDVERLNERKVVLVDTTCGAILNVWKRVEGYAKSGWITVMHGKRRHEETRATVSRALREGGAYLILENPAEARELADVILGKTSEADYIAGHPGFFSPDFTFHVLDCKMGMANQTTMATEESLMIQTILREAFAARFGVQSAEGRFKSYETICSATQDRQDALKLLLKERLDLVVIVGGFNSSNTAHLAEIASGLAPLYHIESAADLISPEEIRARNPKTGKVGIERRWIAAGIRDIGIASGASTPDLLLAEVLEKIASFISL